MVFLQSIPQDLQVCPIPAHPEIHDRHLDTSPDCLPPDGRRQSSRPVSRHALAIGSNQTRTDPGQGDRVTKNSGRVRASGPRTACTARARGVGVTSPAPCNHAPRGSGSNEPASWPGPKRMKIRRRVPLSPRLGACARDGVLAVVPDIAWPLIERGRLRGDIVRAPRSCAKGHASFFRLSVANCVGTSSGHPVPMQKATRFFCLPVAFLSRLAVVL